MQKTIQELNGTVCIEMEDVAPAKKQILSSRSFGIPVRDYASLSESVTLYMSRAAEKLRKQHSYAGSIYVHIRTSPFKLDEPYYGNGMTISLPSHTDDTRQLVNVALWGLRQLYKPNFNYQKAFIFIFSSGNYVNIFMPSNTPSPTNTARTKNIKKNTLAILDAPDSTPLNPNNPAITEITKKTIA